MNNSENDLFDFFIKESQIPFMGWDFSYFYITERMVQFPLSWNYANKVMSKLKDINTLLDMGTGGGEYLSKIKPLPKKTYATEYYKPNIQIAKINLKPFGIKVIGLENHNSLPFNNNFFDLIINRHSTYEENEIFRIIKNKGCFITQQVGGKNNIKINEDLQTNYKSEQNDRDLDHAVKKLIAAGFKIIEKKEEYPISRFYDIGALIYYLKAISWQINDFNIEKYHDRLKNIHDKIIKNGYYETNAHRFYILAAKI